jgi:hypothetical protein
MTVSLREVCRYSERLAMRFALGAIVSVIATVWVGGALTALFSYLAHLFIGATIAAALVRIRYEPLTTRNP